MFRQKVDFWAGRMAAAAADTPTSFWTAIDAPLRPLTYDGSSPILLGVGARKMGKRKEKKRIG